MLGENERFIGVTESLNEHNHDGGNLEASGIDAELLIGEGFVGEK